MTILEKRLSRKLRKGLEDSLSNSLRTSGILTSDDIPVDNNTGAPSVAALVGSQFG